MNHPETIPIPVPVIEGIVAYLLTRPMKEVEQGVAAIRQAVHEHQQAQDRLAARMDEPLDPATERAVAAVVNGTPED